ncbi:hypothetical protein ACQKOF_06645 [Lysinibacillus sp. NPDC093190]|uniref:hypothetical protein n=1 Tax=Lysinibacillus sp. NPDC093190 TaxID=3390575 RepID=UPI003D05D08A
MSITSETFLVRTIVPIGVGFCGVMLVGTGITKLVDEKIKLKNSLLRKKMTEIL